jgi:hypothetical protein
VQVADVRDLTLRQLVGQVSTSHEQKEPAVSHLPQHRPVVGHEPSTVEAEDLVTVTDREQRAVSKDGEVGYGLISGKPMLVGVGAGLAEGPDERGLVAVIVRGREPHGPIGRDGDAVDVAAATEDGLVEVVADTVADDALDAGFHILGEETQGVCLVLRHDSVKQACQ